MEFLAPIVFFVLLVASFLIPRAMVCRAEEECVSLLRVWMEENGQSLLRHRLIWVVHGGDSPPRAIYLVNLEDLQGRRRAGWASIVGRNTALREFIPARVEFQWIRPPQIRLRTVMVLVLYTAIDLALLRAALTRGSLFFGGTFYVLTLFVPAVAYDRWRTAQSRQADEGHCSGPFDLADEQHARGTR